MKNTLKILIEYNFTYISITDNLIFDSIILNCNYKSEEIEYTRYRGKRIKFKIFKKKETIEDYVNKYSNNPSNALTIIESQNNYIKENARLISFAGNDRLIIEFGISISNSPKVIVTSNCGLDCNADNIIHKFLKICNDNNIKIVVIDYHQSELLKSSADYILEK